MLDTRIYARYDPILHRAVAAIKHGACNEFYRYCFDEYI